MQEIDTSDWLKFCQRLNHEQQGSVVSIEVLERDGIQSGKGRDLRFQSVAFDTRGDCNNIIRVHAGDGSEVKHEIIEPIHIRLREADEHGTFNPVTIEAESGITFLTFHPALHAQILDGLKLIQTV
jgi:hypothetical protein